MLKKKITLLVTMFLKWLSDVYQCKAEVMKLVSTALLAN